MWPQKDMCNTKRMIKSANQTDHQALVDSLRPPIRQSDWLLKIQNAVRDVRMQLYLEK